MKHTLNNLPFSNSFAALGDDFFSRIEPTPFESVPVLLHFNPDAAALLDLDPAAAQDPRCAEVFSGKHRMPGMDPLAMLYAGHQFGVRVPQLGDGRAIILGETTNSRGERWEIQLKGSGQTPYSRGADGRAVLRSSIREYLCSEAMHALAIPTTRALCLVGSQDPVYRERIETGAMVTRLAPSHVRFGSFEVFYYRDQHAHTRTLADYVIKHHYPELDIDPGDDTRYLRFFVEVVSRTARLIAQWQAVGFAHGVLNTDNMSILGLTLDYGPFGFLEAYDPDFICNHSDHHGRYAFKRQPEIGLFNLSCLAQALLPLMDFEDAKAALQAYRPQYEAHYAQLMAAKLGLPAAEDGTQALRDEWLAMLHASRADYTRAFRALCALSEHDGAQAPAALRDQFVDRARFDRWVQDYRARVRSAARLEAERAAHMRALNPKYVLRNYLAQTAIEQAERGDTGELSRLMQVLKSPFDEHAEAEHYAAAAPDWAHNLQVSCSS